MSSYRRYYLPRVSWSDVKGGVWRIQPYNVTDYFFIFRVQNLLTSAIGKQASGGKSCKTGKIPQPEAKGKQAGLGKSRKIGKIPQPEAAGKQADWGKSRKIRRIPHPEAVKKQVHWGENVKLAIKPQLASGVAGTAGLFVHHVQLSVGDDGFCAGTFATVGT